MNNNHIDLNNSEIEAIRATFDGFKYYESKKREERSVDHIEFMSHAYYAHDLFRGLQEICDNWGTNSFSFYNLEQIFSQYFKKHPEDIENTFSLFVAIFELISKILENKSLIYNEANRYDCVLRATDSYNTHGEYNSDLIFKKRIVA